MKRYWTSAAVAVAAILILSACEMAQRGTATDQRFPSAGDFAGLNVYVNGVRTDQADVGELRERLTALKSVGVNTAEERQRTATLLADIDEGRIDRSAVPEELRGIGGFHTRLVLRTAVSRPGEVETQKLSGKIRRYLFNDQNNSGYLEVDTTVETFVNGNLVGKDAYWWAIAVMPGSYGVFKKDNTNPNDPFPGTIPLPDSALDPDNPGGIVQRGLDHKLFAKGKGIVVLAVKKNGKMLPATDPVYASSVDSCIDILFRGYPPEDTLPPQSAYCLGRCAHPMVVNTGA